MILKPLLTIRCRSLVAATAAAVFGLAPLAHAEEPIGQVSLVIGQARVVRANGTVEALQRGASLLVGDRIETSVSGHVHVRFIDNAAVSVRPDSTLEIQSYRYDAQRPQANEVRLRVDQGTSRAISGAATEIDKTRFRLNTPIAAIGVRGTDFVVQTDATGLRATVADGSIVVGALGVGCSAATLGPCAGDTKVLSADMGRVMIEMRPGERVARVVPAGQALALAANDASERAAERAAAMSAARAAGMSAAEPSLSEKARGNDRAAAELLVIAADAAQEKSIGQKQDRDASLVWGRWTPAAASHDKLTDPFAIASLGRHATVADEYAVLLRSNDPSDPNNRTLRDTGEAQVSFRLTRAQASFETGSSVEAASVDAGSTLALDFARRTFATALGLSSASGGKAELRMAGDVRADGTFAVRDLDQRIAGAVSFDGKEAGYLFERAVAGGLFRGRTLWGR